MMISVINVDGQEHSLMLIVIEKENLDRMRKADPITIVAAAKGGRFMQLIRYPKNLSLLLAYEEDDAELYRLGRAGDMIELLKYLERGRTFDPTRDGPENIVNL